METKIICKLCLSKNIDIVYFPDSPTIKNSSDCVSFHPTVSDFGIFYKLARCRDCGMQFYVIENGSLDINSIYSQSQDNLYPLQAAERGMAYKKIIENIKKSAPVNGRLLDVGCSYGLFLNLAKENGFEAQGVEINKDACKYCIDTFGLRVFCGDLKSASFPDNYFDVVTALEVIEHLEDPIGFINLIYQILKPGGIFYIVTPNFESLSGKLLRYKWWSYRRMHLCYFSKKTLHRSLLSAGFSIVGSSPYKKTFLFGYMLSQFKNAGYSRLFHFFFSKLTKLFCLDLFPVTASFGDIAVIARKIKS